MSKSNGIALSSGIVEIDNYLEIIESYNFIYKEINQIQKKFIRSKKQDESDDSSDSTNEGE